MEQRPENVIMWLANVLRLRISVVLPDKKMVALTDQTPNYQRAFEEAGGAEAVSRGVSRLAFAVNIFEITGQRTKQSSEYRSIGIEVQQVPRIQPML